MFGKTDICNLALGYLNHPPIQGLDEATPEAELCSRLLPSVVERLLGRRAWSFATRRITLRRLSGEASPFEGMPSVFALPGDCVRVVCVDGGQQYVREATKLYADGDEAVLEYVKLVEDPAVWPSTFASAVAYLLAAEMCPSISGNMTLHQILYKRHQEEAARAACEDAAENYEMHQPIRRPGRWLSAHLGGI